MLDLLIMLILKNSFFLTWKLLFKKIFFRNSLILFILNLKELKEKYWKGLVLSLEAYERLRKLAR